MLRLILGPKQLEDGENFVKKMLKNLHFALNGNELAM
jgi:hypothetical protein